MSSNLQKMYHLVKIPSYKFKKICTFVFLAIVK